MCNSSFIINGSTVLIGQGISWFCMCQDHFGPSVVVSLSILCFIVGTPIHCWSLWVFLRGNIKPNMVFPLNITILELLFSIQCFADFIDFKYSTMASYNLSTFLIGLTWTFRPLIQICTCMEQYMAVIHPLTFLRYKGIQYRIALVAVAWITAVGNGLRLVFIGLEYFPDHVFFLVFYISVMIISFCCVSVLYALKHPGPGERTDVERHNKTDRGRAVANQQKNRAFKIISHSLVFIMICYLPQGVAYFMRIAKISKHVYICIVSPLILTFSMTAILISPLVKMYNESQIKQIMCFSKLRE